MGLLPSIVSPSHVYISTRFDDPQFIQPRLDQLQLARVSAVVQQVYNGEPFRDLSLKRAIPVPIRDKTISLEPINILIGEVHIFRMTFQVYIAIKSFRTPRTPERRLGPSVRFEVSVHV